VERLPSLARRSSEISPPAAGTVAMVRVTRGINDREEERVAAVRRRRVEDNMFFLFLSIYD
jgi:hypothetical protein